MSLVTDLWPSDLKVTANSEAATCLKCREAANLPPVQVSKVLADAVEEIKAAPATSAMEVLARALEGSITIQELTPLAHAVALEMHQGTPS
jgi:hypothetical protein